MIKAKPHPDDPEGYVAVLTPIGARSCDLCALHGSGRCSEIPCFTFNRPDDEIIHYEVKVPGAEHGP